VTSDLTERGVHAGDLLSAIARLVGGGGGGRRPDFATAGGKDPSGLPEALARAEDVIAETLK
jgi:alanyl-tRNA synthetase